jgi:hypothetical protein
MRARYEFSRESLRWYRDKGGNVHWSSYKLPRFLTALDECWKVYGELLYVPEMNFHQATGEKALGLNEKLP